MAVRNEPFSNCLAGGGATGALIRDFDWSATSLGPIAGWSQSLTTMLGFLLCSPVPMVMLWGEDGVMLYNDAYSVFAGGRHPQLLGSKVREGWPEVAAFNDHVMKTGLAGGTLQYRDQELTLHRHGRPEQVFMDLDYSPVPGDDGRPAGVLAIVVETTDRVASERHRRESEARFRSVFDSTLMGFTIFDANTGATLAVNDHFLGMTEHSRADFDAGRWDWRDFTLPEHLALDEAAIAQARARGWWDAYEKEYLRRDGTRFPVRLSSAPLPDHPGCVLVAIEDITAETAARTALAASEALARAQADELAGIYNAAPVGLCVLDRDLRFVRMNDRLAELNGMPAADHIGRSVREIFPDLTDQAVQTMQRVLDGEEVWGVEFSGTTPAQPGVHRTWRENWLPLRDASGAIVGATISAEEITEAKRVEAALQESETRFRGMADHAPVMMWVTDPTGHCTYLNTRWYTYTGQAPGSGEGFGWLAAVHPDDRPAAEAAFVAANADQRHYRIDFRLRRADGRYRWVIDAAAPRFAGDGTHQGYVGSVIDIDDRREMEDALREANERLEERVAAALAERKLLADIVEATDAQVQVLDLDYRWLAINRACADGYERIYGARPRLGQSLLAFLENMPAQRAAAQALWSRALAGESFVEMGAFGDAAHEIRHYELRFEVLRDGTGAQVAAFLTGRDVTDRMREQTRLADAEEQLRQSQKMEAMGQLTGGVAHDFNNLLSPIVGALDMLQRKGLGGEREQRLIAGAAQSAERARTLVQRLLAFARRQPLQPVPVDLAQLVSGMAELIASTTGPQIRVVVDAGRGLPPAKADPNQLEMAVLNLAVNARDAMPEGGQLRISVDAETVGRQHRSGLKPGRYLHLSVADTGTGMDELTLARAVEPFFSTKGIGKGTGLGLSMVHGLAQQLGGTVTIHSTPGVGTNVELWLPQGDHPAISSEASPGDRAPAIGRGTVLLVDDEDLVRLSTADMLIEFGYDVIEAASAEEALRLLDRGLNPDFVLTDHLMPGMSGTDLARRLQTERPEVKVLLVSGYAETAGIAADLPRLAKPFRHAELAASLSALSAAAPA